jgi:hypothetical protein
MPRSPIAAAILMAIGFGGVSVLGARAFAQVAAPSDATTDAPAPAPAVTPAATPAPADDIDLAALGLDTGQETRDEALRLYGFADFTFTTSMMRDRSFVAVVSNNNQSTFAIGSFNLYLAKNLSPRWRSLGEVRLLYAPNGNTNADGTFNHSTALDNTNFGRTVTWGGISIVRLYLEYDLTSWLTVRAGHFLSPYGIWNVDHGSPVIISTSRPYIVGEQLIPEQQTGLDIFGKKFFGDIGVGYHLTLSNGRGPLEAVQDLDGNKAIGGRVDVSTRWLGQLTLGVSGYAGTFTDRNADTFVPMADGSGVTPIANLISRYSERVIGGDVQFDLEGFHLQAEYLYRELAFDEAGRAKQPLGFAPDTKNQGWYVFAGYRLPWLPLMPFGLFEHYEFPQSMQSPAPSVDAYTFGLNFRPTPSTVLKAQVTYAGIASAFDNDDFLALFVTQAAWAF